VSGTAKKLEPDFRFQKLDLLRNGGLRDIEPGRRFCEAALIGNGQSVTDLPEFHPRTGLLGHSA
jgi:hypothetical protein